MSVTRGEVQVIMEEVFAQCNAMRDAGQKEYAHLEENALANFERVGEYIGVTRESVLSVYLLKHIDGIMAWIKGHRSQRESVKGRIVDAIVYLVLLYAMVKNDEDDLDEVPF